jgi:hypothetical protein
MSVRVGLDHVIAAAGESTGFSIAWKFNAREFPQNGISINSGSGSEARAVRPASRRINALPILDALIQQPCAD